MNVVRQISRRLGRATGVRTRSSAADCIVRTVSLVPDPLKTQNGKIYGTQMNVVQRSCDDFLYGVWYAPWNLSGVSPHGN